MRIHTSIAAIVGLLALAGCASGAAPEPAARAPEAAHYTPRPSPLLVTGPRTDSGRFKPAELPLAHRTLLRTR